MSGRKEINLLIFHHQPVVITAPAALGVFSLGQFQRARGDVGKIDWASLPRLKGHSGGPHLTQQPYPLPLPLSPCPTAQSYNSHYHKDTYPLIAGTNRLKAINQLPTSFICRVPPQIELMKRKESESAIRKRVG